jgi:hypothetical protein
VPEPSPELTPEQRRLLEASHVSVVGLSTVPNVAWSVSTATTSRTGTPALGAVQIRYADTPGRSPSLRVDTLVRELFITGPASVDEFLQREASAELAAKSLEIGGNEATPDQGQRLLERMKALTDPTPATLAILGNTVHGMQITFGDHTARWFDLQADGILVAVYDWSWPTPIELAALDGLPA